VTENRLSPTRRHLLLGAAAAAPLVALGGVSASALGGYRNTAGLTMVDGSGEGGWIHPELRSVDFRFDTGGMVKTFPPSVRVTVPPSYDSSPDRRYPVLLLLHGGGGYFLNWSEWGAIDALAEHEVITVMPDGGAGSFYSNANYPLPGREAAWETFIMEQVLPFVHENFRTDPERMAIAGLSMGGWGALSLGQRYWGHFRSLSNYSGPADCNPDGELVGSLAVSVVIWGGPIADLDKYPGTSNFPGATWGGDLYNDLARSYNPMENIERYRGKRIFLRAGNAGLLDSLGLDGNQPLVDEVTRMAADVGADLQESAVRTTQEHFSGALHDAGIEHSFEVVDGTHNAELWMRCLREDLPGIMDELTA
jgi:S-formylglutathione hydrolase FrmB